MLQDIVRIRAAQPRPHADARVLDEPHLAVWQEIRHLFPPHAMVDPVEHGMLLVSWTLKGKNDAAPHFAAPVLIRIEPGLLLALWTCDPHDRAAIARELEPVVRAHLADYDPHSRVPTCRVIVLGE